MIGCDGKIVFTTWTRANQTAQKMRRKKEERIEAYRCRGCGKFHVGHPTTESVLLRNGRRVGRVARRVAAGAGTETDD